MAPPHLERAVKFINLAKYRDLERIGVARPSHFAYADRLREHGQLAIGGPLVNDDGQRVGLLFIYEADSREAALALAREDPFTLAGALSVYEITEWRLRGVNLDILVSANRSADQSSGDTPAIRLFANYARYRTDKSVLATARPAHWEYDQALERAGKLALAGPFANDEGGLFVYSAASKEEAISFVERDPFAKDGVLAHCDLLEWLIEGVNAQLLTRDFPAVARAEIPRGWDAN